MDFSNRGTRYFVLTSVSMERPFPVAAPLDDYKHDRLEYGLDLEYFHCYRDGKIVRNRVFELIASHLDGMRIDCLVVEKAKVEPALQADRRFYQGNRLNFGGDRQGLIGILCQSMPVAFWEGQRDDRRCRSPD